MHAKVKELSALLKNLKKSADGFKNIRLAVLADNATQFVVKAIRATGIDHGIDYEIFEAEYNQIDFQVFDDGSELYAFKPDYVLILRGTPKLVKQFYNTSAERRSVFNAGQLEYMQSLYRHLTERLSCKIIVNLFPEFDDGVFGNYAGKTAVSFPFQLKKLNVGLMELAQSNKSLFVLHLDILINNPGLEKSFDPKLYINGDMVYSLELLPYLAKNVHDIISAISGSFKKCVILDLDNTTWGGVIGDDGMEGIQIGDLGVGKAFTEFQLWIKELKKRGIVIAVCSKNTELIAKEPFEKHPDMKLHLEDISVFMANWENKVDNIIHIQSILQIGFDSMVFIDDNAFEREMIKSGIADITVPDMPEDPAEYLPYLRSLNLFETASYTEEDESRTQQYREEAQRNDLLRSFKDEPSFLQSLAMTSIVKPLDNFTIPRVAQLSQRSNQFNLRTVRYTEDDINRIANDGLHLALSFNLADKFGDYGLIAFAILQIKPNETLFIDSWIMSCRVLKRGMELFTLLAIIDLAKARGFKKLIGEYIPTKKNVLVKDHYHKLGFSKIDSDTWELNVANYRPGVSIYIEKK